MLRLRLLPAVAAVAALAAVAAAATAVAQDDLNLHTPAALTNADPVLQWSASSDPNLDHYAILRSSGACGHATNQIDTADVAATTYTDANPADGTYCYGVEAREADETPIALSDTLDITVDTTAPNTTAGGPTGSINTTGPSFTFSSSEGSSTFECREDGAGSWSACSSPYQVTWSQGVHTFEVRATDQAGNTDASPASRAFTVDTADPDTSFDSGPSGTITDATPTFEFSSDDPPSTFECKRDAGAWNACTSPYTGSAWSSGSHTLYVRATDAAGNVDGTPASRGFTLDADAPDTTIAGPSGAIADATPTFTFSSDDGSATFECREDLTGSYSACTTPYQHAWSEASHTLQVRAVDAANNVDATPDSISFRVDVTAPQTSLDSGASGTTNDATPTFTFSSPDGTATFECQRDAGAWSACTSPYTGSTWSSGPSHTFSVRAGDAAGNVDGTPASTTFTVDSNAPSATVTGPSGNLNYDDPIFTLSSDDPGATYECRRDNATWSACASPYHMTWGEGNHTLDVRATDDANNTGAPDTASFHVDTVAPPTSLDSGPSGTINDPTPTFTFSSSDGTATFECQRDGAGAWNPCTSPYGAAWSSAAHSFAVRAVDGAGNRDASPPSLSFTVDAVAPETTLNGPTATNTVTPTFTFASDDPTATFQCRRDPVGSDPWTACTTPYTNPAWSAGPHHFEVRARDGAANVDASPATIDFVVDLTAPDTAITAGPAGVTNVSAPTFTFGSDEPATYECSFDNANYAACSNPVTVGPLGDGVYTLFVRAVDAAGNRDGSPASRTFGVDATAPSLALTEPAPGAVLSGRTVTVGAGSFSELLSSVLFQYRVSGSGEGGWTNLGLVAAPPAGSAAVSWTIAALEDGLYDVRAVGTDGAGNVGASAVAPVVVDNTRPAQPGTPTAATPTNGAVALTWPANATDTVGYLVLRNGTRLTASPIGTTTFVDALPRGADGAYAYAVIAVDSAGNESPASAPLSVVYDTTAPGAPGSVEATAAADGSVTVRWAAASDPAAGGVASGLAGYVVRRSAAGGAAPTSVLDGTAVCEVASSVGSCVDRGVARGRTYAYAVFARDTVGNVSPAGSKTGVAVAPAVTPDTAPPPRASALRAAVAGHRVTVSWRNPKAGDLARVVVVVNARRRPRNLGDGKRIYSGKGATKATYTATPGTSLHVAVFAADRTGNVSRAVYADVTVPKALSVLIPATGATLSGTPRLAWHAVKDATYYNVQVFAGKQKVAVAWPKGASFSIPAAKLRKGQIYTWFVWPGFGELSAAKYGKLIGRATFAYR